ncbi:NUDIX domain-containing protein [Nitrosomonas halophila]|uniref:ADP-ribose pyrophosphatase n=1 Tax=Nitrosomonas halophila TaxID=44576 RepID=A0A1H3DWJ0_9PROT|nr:NUDIX domain-containing protein [Nitrosomonas halophila]SDX70707.1 ADP-ribose pyrophosphatase [Nitrosomonas halophila]
MSRDSARPAQAEMGFEVLEKVICFQGFFRMERYRLRHHKFDGGWSRPITRELLERGHAAAVLPYDPERDRVVLIEQFRAGAMSAPGGPWLLEIVAGMIDTDESAEQVVTRESVEEAGCHVSDLIPLYDYLISPGGTTERIALFCGRVDTTGIGGIHGQAEEDEDIKVHVMALAQARALLNSGRIGSASAIIALQWLLLNREIVRQRWLSG